MKRYSSLILGFALILAIGNLIAQTPLDDHLINFDYDSLVEMKVSNEQITQLLIEEKAILVDIRFIEEQQAWAMDYALKIPLNELPLRLAELPDDKLIVTACPHKDRAIVAMMFLKSKGYQQAI